MKKKHAQKDSACDKGMGCSTPKARKVLWCHCDNHWKLGYLVALYHSQSLGEEGKGNGLELRVPEVYKATLELKNCCD